MDCAGDYISLNGAFQAAVIKGNVMIPIDVAPLGFGVKLRGTSETIVADNHFGPSLTPARTENDTQSSPATPVNVHMVRNTFERFGGFASTLTGSNIVRAYNINIATSEAFEISGGVLQIPIGHKWVVVDTESGAATDDLDTINGADRGDVVTFTGASSLRESPSRTARGI